ncbi:hypothetical protein [Arthrobacter rhombi]|uniref:hypothetical protein n=1 Tax=Arthrobacter rhombi TaxID=71253 RepID=UPI003FD3CD66
MRLQQPIYPKGDVASVQVRFVARDVPTSASVTVTDIQLQPGEQPSGVVPNPREVGTTPGRAQYRNGIVNDTLDVIALGNADRAAPVRLDVRNASGNTRVGSFRFGNVKGAATVDGAKHSATQGWGRAPIITERQDLHIRAEATGRIHLRARWNERGP